VTTIESLEYDDLVERLMRGASGLFTSRGGAIPPGRVTIYGMP
jgi:hypothetical protein